MKSVRLLRNAKFRPPRFRDRYPPRQPLAQGGQDTLGRPEVFQMRQQRPDRWRRSLTNTATTPPQAAPGENMCGLPLAEREVLRNSENGKESDAPSAPAFGLTRWRREGRYVLPEILPPCVQRQHPRRRDESRSPHLTPEPSPTATFDLPQFRLALKRASNHYGSAQLTCAECRQFTPSNL